MNLLKIYACLAGKWVCLTDDPDCKIGEKMQSPSAWWEENAPIYVPDTSSRNTPSFYELSYVHVSYKGNDWRIHPIYIQIVNG